MLYVPQVRTCVTIGPALSVSFPSESLKVVDGLGDADRTGGPPLPSLLVDALADGHRAVEGNSLISGCGG